ncbi:MAG: FMN-binding protein [Lachnospiraceae bacterium]|nr:FMN-binding protein [Candidatus Equihabitans merdae]
MSSSKEKSNMWQDYLRPIVVLLVICLAVATLLAFVNNMTAPLIAENEEKSANAAYFEALPEADHFTELPCDMENVLKVLKADNGAGYVITAQAKGYGGAVPAAVAFSEDGKILNVYMMENGETPGMGQKVRDQAFSGQFAGMDAAPFTISDIDAITGATISSKASVEAINLAIAAYDAVVKGGAA